MVNTMFSITLFKVRLLQASSFASSSPVPTATTKECHNIKWMILFSKFSHRFYLIYMLTRGSFRTDSSYPHLLCCLPSHSTVPPSDLIPLTSIMFVVQPPCNNIHKHTCNLLRATNSPSCDLPSTILSNS